MRAGAIAIAVGHVLLIASYTMPQDVVPTRVRYWSQAYARVLFHQDWRLFAPDPPACGCSIMVQDARAPEPSKLEDLHHGFIWKRMASNACRYAEASCDMEHGHVVVGEALGHSLLGMAGGDPRSDSSGMYVFRTCGCRGSGLWEIRFAQTRPQ